MKKIIACTLAAVVFNIFSPVVPLAHAGIVENQLTQIIAKDDNIARIQQLMMVKKQLEQGNQKGVLEALAKAAIDQSGQGGDIHKMAENAILEQVGKSITEKIAPYEKEVAMISALLNNQTLAPQTTRESNSLTGAPQNYKRILNMTATAYGPGMLDNGKWNNLTYMGGTVKHGVVAVDPRVIPMGTKLWVEGYGEAIAEDQGSAIKGNRIDLAFNDRNEALDYGIQNVKIYILN
ncbi:3D domain-containing protein [Pelosinus sp. sgz500959]|uniref:3D domain-containing protein n=1 Tax=Pelosinus sp. sgz500959 TaxID=3242472 RepID=UPI0036730448